MATTIGNLSVMLTANSIGLTAGLNHAAKRVRAFGLQAGAGLGMAGKGLGSFTGGLGMAVPGLAAIASPVTAAVVGLGAAVAAGAIFEKRMSSVAAVLDDATTPNMVRLTAFAREMGLTTQFSALSAAEAMTAFAQAGLKTQQIVDALPATLNLAVAGEIDLAEATGIAVKAMSQFHLKATDMAHISDVLAVGAAQSNTNVHKLGESLVYSGVFAHAAGKSLEETVAATMALAQAGLDADMAGTAMRGMLTKQANQSGPAQEALKELGLTFEDLATGKFKTFPRIIDEFNEKMAGMSEFKRMELLSNIFEQRAATGFLAVLGQGSAQIRDWEAQLTNSFGAAEKQALTKSDNVAGAFARIVNVLTDVGIGIFNVFEPALRPLLEGIAAIFRYLSPVIKGFENLNIVGTLVKMTMSRLSDVLRPLWEDVASVLGPLSSGSSLAMTSFLDAVKAAYGRLLDFVSPVWRAMVGAARGALELIGRIFSTFLSPGITAVQIGLDFAKSSFQRVADFVMPIITSIRDFFVKSWIAIEFVIRNLPEVIELAFVTVQVKVLSLVQTMLDIFQGNLPAIGRLIGAIFETTIDAVTTFMRSRFVGMIRDALVAGPLIAHALLGKLFGMPEVQFAKGAALAIDFSGLKIETDLADRLERAREREKQLLGKLKPAWEEFEKKRWAEVFAPDKAKQAEGFIGPVLAPALVGALETIGDRYVGGFGMDMPPLAKLAEISDELPKAMELGSKDAVSAITRHRLGRGADKIDPQLAALQKFNDLTAKQLKADEEQVRQGREQLAALNKLGKPQIAAF